MLMKSIEVVAAVIRRGDKIFATQRGYGEFEGWWEFPGGKMEAGETPRDALRREIREELDSEVSVGELIRTVEWDYPSFHLTMHCYWCRLASGTLHLLEHEDARWLDAPQLDSVKWLPADLDILPQIKQGLARPEFVMRQATEADIPVIMQMADRVFRLTYAEILSPEQMDYMMDWMYSAQSLRGQICDEGRWFFLAEADGIPAGYLSFEYEDTLPDGRKRFHLQKLYALPEYQHSGLGRMMMEYAERFLAAANPEGCRMELNVNRYNSAVGFYERIGLRRDRQGDFHIGHGYYMNDYIYAIDLQGLA